MSLISFLYSNPVSVILMVSGFMVLVILAIVLIWQHKKRMSESEKSRILAEKNAQLQDALYAAEKANSAKSQFTSRMSHEIRTPLNAIIGYNSLASDIVSGMSESEGAEKTQLDSCLKKADSASRHLLDIVNDVLDLSSIESGKMQIARESFDLPLSISSVTELLASQAGEKGVDFVVEYCGFEEFTIVGDALRLNQIIMNLLSNAVKFTPSGGRVLLSVSVASAREDDVRLRFEVSDTGIGMEENFLNHLFEPYEQQDSGIARAYGGTGLGLSIVKNLVNLMGGTIDVVSAPGAGSTFTVLLPFGIERERETAPATAGEPSESEPGDLSGLRVLIVEDNEMNMEIATELLLKKNILVEQAENGAAAVEKFLAAAPGHYDLVLMDIQMPVMDGHTATREIRASAHPDAKTVPILAMSADAFAEDVTKSLAAGMNGHIAKPVNVKELYETLARFAGK